MAHDPIGKLYDQFTPTERLTLTLEAMGSGKLTEAERLINACPRKVYSGNDAAFTMRMEMAFKLSLLASTDLRWLWGQVLALKGAIEVIQLTSGLHHINAEMAFLEGITCSQGRPQIPYYAHREKHLEGDDDAPAEVDEISPAASGAQRGNEDESCCDLSVLGKDFPRRAAAVELRAEGATAMTVKVMQREMDHLLRELVEVWAALERFAREQVGVDPRTLLRASGFSDVAELEAEIAAAVHIKPRQAEVDGYCKMMAGVWKRKFFGEGNQDGD